MSKDDRASLYAALKNIGYEFDEHYRDYSYARLKQIADEVGLIYVDEPQPVDPFAGVPRGPAPDNALPAAHVYKDAEGEETPIRVDEMGRVWFREEVRKPAYPKPRARRKIRYVETGVRQQEVVNGRYTESFEVAGDSNQISEVKITMPSYQVGLYKDPRFPFKVHVYNDQRGFSLFDVQKFYGGADLVPASIKRVYIENDLCYDMRTTIRTIQEEARALDLKG